MAVRGVYSDIEQQILEDWNKEADTRQGRPMPRSSSLLFPTTGSPEATFESMKTQAFNVDPWNPFWYKPEYAATSRWGGIIGHPFYVEQFKPYESMVKSHKGYFLTFYLLGHDFEYFQPIRPGDNIKAWQYRPSLEDATGLDGEGPRKFRYIDVRCDYINQRDEIVAKFNQPVFITLYEGLPPVEEYLPDYGYTQEELDYLTELYENEKPRGAEIRYWEDVQVGNETQPVTTGPTSYQSAGMKKPEPLSPEGVPMRTMDRYKEPLGGPIEFGYVPDRETGLLYPTHGIGRHVSDRAAQYEGGRRAWIFNYVSRWPLLRSVTNWMGNDAFLCKFSWRHIWRTPVGDALVVHGEVVKKYVEDGEHLVDLKTWCLNLRGCVTDFATSTVKLVSKEDGGSSARKVIRR